MENLRFTAKLFAFDLQILGQMLNFHQNFLFITSSFKPSPFSSLLVRFCLWQATKCPVPLQQEVVQTVYMLLSHTDICYRNYSICLSDGGQAVYLE